MSFLLGIFTNGQKQQYKQHIKISKEFKVIKLYAVYINYTVTIL
jgi:hypothetical protein